MIFGRCCDSNGSSP